MVKWLLVVACVGIIFTTIPLARSLQKLVYNTIGKEFFTYFVLFTILAGLAVLLSVLVGRLRIRRPSQYLWIILTCGSFIYFTFQLSEHPEEAVHLIEYGILACLVFNALGHRIKDWTAYITAGLLVAFIGSVDECVQWFLPSRFWDYKDVAINAFAGLLSLLAINRGIRPVSFQGKVTVYSLNCLVASATGLIIFLALCLTNTPGAVSRYTQHFPPLSWLMNEEPMTEYGYEHSDPEIGTFYSRFTREKLREFDRRQAKELIGVIADPWDDQYVQSLKERYTPFTNPFLHEFLIHQLRMRNNYNEFMDTGLAESGRTALMEYRILKKYFSDTLLSSAYAEERINLDELRKAADTVQGGYISEAGKLITSFNIRTVWIMTVIILAALWGGKYLFIRYLH